MDHDGRELVVGALIPVRPEDSKLIPFTFNSLFIHIRRAVPWARTGYGDEGSRETDQQSRLKNRELERESERS